MRGKDVRLEDVVMRFGDFTAVESTNLTVNAGEFFSILGPSGCGKTTILRMVSGFIDPSEGDIFIGEEAMRGLGPAKRPTALIFQNLALFPLMSNWENVAFGLEARGISKSKRRERAYELLALVGLQGQETKTPNELSGGQKQRVAIARALAVEPAVLLLDEPLSALDLKLRQYMRAELKEIQRKTGVTFIFITHDQGEALTMSDRIAVMRNGVIEQVDTVDNIYASPKTPFVATFVGENNVFEGAVCDSDPDFVVLDTPLGKLRGVNQDGLSKGETAMLFVRPERTRRIDTGAGGGAGGGANLPDNTFEAEFQRRDLEGAFVNLFFCAGGRNAGARGGSEGDLIVHEANLGPNTDLSGMRTLGFDAADAVAMRPGALNDEVEGGAGDE